MVEKWDPVLGTQEPGTLSTSGSHGLPGTPGPLVPWNPWDLRTSGPLRNYLYRLNSESRHPETLKLEHKQRTFLNYIIGQSQTKAENCVYPLTLFYLSSC